MPSTNKTPNFGLNDWISTDKPVRADFVADNRIIDGALANKVNLPIIGQWKDNVRISGGTIAGDYTFTIDHAIFHKTDKECYISLGIINGQIISTGTGRLTIEGLPYTSTIYASLSTGYYNAMVKMPIFQAYSNRIFGSSSTGGAFLVSDLQSGFAFYLSGWLPLI